MNAKKIMFPTDFSESSRAALRHATALARDTGAELLIVHVLELPSAATDMGFGGYPLEADEQAAQKELSEIKPTDPQVPFSQKLVMGHPADEIVKLAKDEDVDMVVMGTHGRRGLTRLLMGSVAEAVVRRAGCPVLTLRQSREVPAETN